MTGIEPASARARRLASESSSPGGPHSAASSRASAEAARDVVAHGRRGAAQRGGLERGDQRVADRGAGLEAARERDDGHAVGAGALGQRAAGGGDDARRAGVLGRVVGRDRLLRRARVARAEHERLAADPRRDVVAHGQRERAAQLRPEHGRGEPAADRGAAHAGDDQAAVGVDGRDGRRVDAPQRVLEMDAEVERLGELPGGVDRAAGGGIESNCAIRRECLRRGCRRRGTAGRRW